MGQLAEFFTVAQPTTVPADVQNTRDQGSLSILQAELKKAQGLLPMAKTPQEKLRYESDILGLTREIKNLGGQVETPTQSLASFFTAPTQQEKQLSEEEELAAASKPYFGTPRIAKRPGQPPTPQTGAGETLLSLLSAPGAMFGMVGGGLSGAYQEAKAGQFGTPEAANRIEKAMAAGAQKYSYTPRTPEGQEMTADLQRLLGGLPPVVPELAGVAPLVAPAMTEAKTIPAAIKSIEPRQSLRDQLQAQFQAKQAPQVAPSGFQSGGAAAATTPAMMQANIEAAIAQASPELASKVKSVPPTQVNLPALETRALEEKHGINLSHKQRIGDIAGYAEEWNRRGESPILGEHFSEQPKQFKASFENLMRKHAPDINEFDPSSIGQMQINALGEKDLARRTAISQAYKDLENANAGQFPIDVSALQQNIDAALKKQLRTEYVPSEVNSVLKDIYKKGSMTFEEFEALRTLLADEMRTNSKGNARAASHIVRQQLEELPIPENLTEVKALADKARSLHKERMDVIKSNPAYKSAVKEFADASEAASTGESLNAEKFHQKFVSSGTPESIRRLKAEIADNPQAMQALAVGEIRNVMRKAGLAGEVPDLNPKTMTNFIADNKGKLQEALGPQATQDLMEIALLASKVGMPKTGTFNYSNSFSGMLADMAKKGMSNVAEAKLAGLTQGASVVPVAIGKQFMQKFNKDQFAKEATNPYAGIVKGQ